MAITTGWECPVCHAGVSPMCMRCPCRSDKTEQRAAQKGAQKGAQVYDPNLLSKLARSGWSPPKDGFGQAGVAK